VFVFIVLVFIVQRRMAQWTVLRGRPLDDQSDDEEEGEEEEEEELNLDDRGPL